MLALLAALPILFPAQDTETPVRVVLTHGMMLLRTEVELIPTASHGRIYRLQGSDQRRYPVVFRATVPAGEYEVHLRVMDRSLFGANVEKTLGTIDLTDASEEETRVEYDLRDHLTVLPIRLVTPEGLPIQGQEAELLLRGPARYGSRVTSRVKLFEQAGNYGIFAEMIPPSGYAKLDGWEDCVIDMEGFTLTRFDSPFLNEPIVLSRSQKIRAAVDIPSDVLPVPLSEHRSYAGWELRATPTNLASGLGRRSSANQLRGEDSIVFDSPGRYRLHWLRRWNSYTSWGWNEIITIDEAWIHEPGVIPFPAELAGDLREPDEGVEVRNRNAGDTVPPGKGAPATPATPSTPPTPSKPSPPTNQAGGR